jgi:regulator of sirC expression with transglutaminase-like and TPR domain
VFHAEFGFTGDAESYDAPLNADLIRVLDRRAGSRLACRCSMSPRRGAWAGTAYALNTPGHVLVRIGDGRRA